MFDVRNISLNQELAIVRTGDSVFWDNFPTIVTVLDFYEVASKLEMAHAKPGSFFKRSLPKEEKFYRAEKRLNKLRVPEDKRMYNSPAFDKTISDNKGYKLYDLSSATKEVKNLFTLIYIMKFGRESDKLSVRTIELLKTMYSEATSINKSFSLGRGAYLEKVGTLFDYSVNSFGFYIIAMQVLEVYMEIMEHALRRVNNLHFSYTVRSTPLNRLAY